MLVVEVAGVIGARKDAAGRIGMVPLLAPVLLLCDQKALYHSLSEAKLEELKAAIEAGDYHVDTRKLAASILNSDLGIEE